MTFQTTVKGTQIMGNRLEDVMQCVEETLNRKPRYVGFSNEFESKKKAPRVEMNAVDEIMMNMRAQII